MPEQPNHQAREGKRTVEQNYDVVVIGGGLSGKFIFGFDVPN